MHIYVLIPVCAMLSASALAGAVLATGPRLRASWSLAAMLVCTAAWALCELMAGLTTDPSSAVVWFRASTLFGLSFGPLGLAMVAEVRPPLREALIAQAKLLFVAIALLSAISLATAWTFSGVSREGVLVGWQVHFGPLAPWVMIVGAGAPFYAILRFVRSRESDALERKPRQLGRLVVVVLLPMSVALLTDAVLPLLGIDAPRLATLCMVLLGGQFWLPALHGPGGLISDSGFARAILDDLPDGVVVVDRDGLIRSSNATFAEFVERHRADLLGRRLQDFVGQGFELLPGRLVERELQLARDGGDPIPVALSSMPIEDRQGGVIGLVVLVRDLRAVLGLRRQLVASGRLAAVGELAAGIAHEVNNPIAFIQANLNQLRRHRRSIEEHVAEAGVRFESPLGLMVSGDEPIDDAQKQITRVAEIVQEVRALAHTGTEARGLCDLNDLLDGVLRLATLQRRGCADVERDQVGLPDVVCASQAMKQVFLSLIRRAMAAAGRSGRVQVRTFVEDDRAVVSIEDDGTPVPADHSINLLFDPFDPAMGEWGGLELGLSHQLVRDEGGEMQVAPRAAGGTCVRVEMPLPSSESESTAGGSLSP